nr:carboxypeptidase regulatory-like domain-containing protein [Planctomycetota bacterium]
TVDPAGFRSSYSQLEAGPQSLSLPEGQYSLCVETDSPGGYVLGPFMLPVGGLDLGTLSIGTGAIYGTVEKPDEKPWPRMRVEIWRDDNWFGGESLTNEAGEFSFDTLGPGLYKIVVVPSRSHLVFAAEQMVWVQLHAGENVRTPTFQIAQDSGIKCQLRGSFSLARSGFLWDGARLELAPIGADGTFSFSNRGSESIVGIYSIQSSALQVIQEKVGDPEIPHLFLAESLSSQVYRFLLPNGQPAAGASVKFLVGNGFCLPGSATLNSEGNLELKSSGCEDSSLLVAVGGMESYRVHFRDLIHGDNFLGGEHLWSEISCFDLSGIPIHGATLWNPSDHCQTITNERGYGRISGKPSGGYLLIEKEGFWSIRAEPLPSFAVVLRRTVDHVLLSTPIGLPISELEVTPLFSLGYQFSLVVSRGPGVDEWVLRGIPEGAFSVRGLGNDGSILLDTSVTLSAKSSRHVPLN